MRFTSMLAALLVLPAITVFGQDTEKEKPRRLESVTWDSVKHQLTWVVSSGEKKTSSTDEGKDKKDKKDNGDNAGNADNLDSKNYKPLAQEKYIIDMDNATMTFHGETRRFSTEEAKRVHTLMDLIAKYAVESTVWWEDGQGEKVDGKEELAPGRRTALYITPCPDRLQNLLVAYSPVPHRL